MYSDVQVVGPDVTVSLNESYGVAQIPSSDLLSGEWSIAQNIQSDGPKSAFYS